MKPLRYLVRKYLEFLNRRLNKMQKTIADLETSVGNLEAEVAKLKPAPAPDVEPLVNRVDAMAAQVKAFNVANNPAPAQQ